MNDDYHPERIFGIVAIWIALWVLICALIRWLS
jgi:hypothetical protein